MASGGEGANLDGLLKWSFAHSDGTHPARIVSEEDRKWFMEAMQAQRVDVVKRMKEITAVMTTPEEVLESQGITPTDIVGMLDELQDHVESIDMANDLHTIGGLVPLLGYLKNSDAGIRAKAADVVTTIVQNNPHSQQLVMEVSGFEPLLTNFTSDSDATVRTKALGAISALIRNNKPGIAAFRLANGYAALRDALGYENIRFQMKALHLIEYLLTENKSDCGVVMELGFPRLMVHLTCSDDSDVREAALEVLLEISRYRKPEVDVSGLADDDKLSYSEPSLLREKGLAVLPGEETLQMPPDVAGKMFESPLLTCAPNHSAISSSNLASEKKDEKPQMLPGPPDPAVDGRSNTNGGR